MAWFSVPALFASASLAACALAPHQYTQTVTTHDVALVDSPAGEAPESLLTSRELAAKAPTEDTYTAVQRLRPSFLRIRLGWRRSPQERAPAIHVFIDGTYAGGVEVLRMIPLSSVESISRVQPTISNMGDGRIRAGDSVLAVRLH